LAADLPTTKAPDAPPAAVAAPNPFDLNLTYTGEEWDNSGGLKDGANYMYGFDASLGVDLQKLLGIPNARFYAEGFYVGGQSQDFKYTGALEAPSALDAFQSMDLGKLYQLYYEQQFGSTNVLVGKYDTQEQFGTTRPMDLFADKGQAINMAFLAAGQAAGYNDPSLYPNTAVGLRIKQTLNDQWTVKLGLLDGISDSPDARNTTDFVFGPQYGVLGIGEVDYAPDKYTKLIAGGWTITGQIDKLGQFSPTYKQLTTWGDAGGYFGGATRLYTIAGPRGIDGFFNVGLTNGVTNIIDKSFDAGLTFTGLLPFRPGDKLGAAVSVVENSQGWKNVSALYYGDKIANYETDYELTYRAKITDWLNVQPEADYIVHPSIGTRGNGQPLPNALSVGFHFELHKEFN